MAINSIFNLSPVDPITGRRLKSSNSKRTLGIRDKQILYRRAKKKCEACDRKIDFDEMHSGHKNAASKGGSATLRNSVCICARCNKLQGTDSWSTFMRKSGKSKTTTVTSSRTKKGNRKITRKQSVSYDIFGNPIKKQRRPKSIFNLGF